MAKTLTYKKVKYEILDDNTLRVAKNEKFIGPLVIPETIEKNGSIYQVVAIEGGAFTRSGITSVEIPGSIREISFHSFSDTPLETVTLHNGIEKIGDRAFMNCKITSICIPESVNTIEDGTFKGCVLLADISFDKPLGIIEVMFSSFEGTRWLSDKMQQSDCLIIGSTLVGVVTKNKQYQVPEGINYISPFAFKKCPHLKEVILPEGITELAYGVFSKCESLERIQLPGTLKIIGVRVDEEYKREGTFNDCCSLKEIALPEGIEELGSNSFSGCSSLKDFLIPQTVCKIGKYVFSNCTSLTEMKIPEGVTDLREGVFSGCTSLKTVHLPESLTRIWKRSFKDCYKLSSLTLPHSIKGIGAEVFWECYNLSSIELPDGIEVIRDGAFGLCNSLSSIRIPTTVRSIGKNAFWSCYGLREALTSDGNTINDSAVFSNCPNLGKKAPKEAPTTATIDIMSDPYQCECFINLSEKDVSLYMNDKYSDPLDDGYNSTTVSYVKWGQYRGVTINEKEVPFDSLFFRPAEYFYTKWAEHNDDLQIVLSKLKRGYYGIIDRREMHKSLTRFHIELKGIPFNKYCMKLLRMRDYGSPIQNALVPNLSLSDSRLLYCGEEIDGEFQYDMGSQGQVKRIVFYKDKDGIVKVIGEYTY